MAENFVAEAWSEWAIAISVIFFRFYARISTHGIKELALDDLFMVLAALAYTTENTAAYFVGAYWLGLANSGMTDEQRAALDPHSEEWRLRVNGSKTHVVGWFTYTTLMWLLKGCWIVYYSRLTGGVHKMDLRIKIGYVLIAVSYVAAIFIIVFKCLPLEKQWQIFPDPGNNCQPGFSRLQVSSIMALNTVTDLYLMAIPLPMIYKAHLALRKKITLMVLFSGGFLVMIFGILRCVSLLTVGETDPAQSGEWSVRESFVAVLVSNFPIVFPVIQRWYRKARGQSSKGNSSMEPSYPLRSNPKHSQGNSRSDHKRSKHSHPLSIPNDTAWGSDDAIVVAEEGKSDIVNREFSASSKESDRSISGRNVRSPPSNGQITVVQEYSVQEARSDELDPVNQRNNAPFRFARK